MCHIIVRDCIVAVLRMLRIMIITTEESEDGCDHMWPATFRVSEQCNSAAVPRVSAAIFAEQSGHLQSVEMWKRSRNYSGVLSAPHPTILLVTVTRCSHWWMEGWRCSQIRHRCGTAPWSIFSWCPATAAATPGHVASAMAAAQVLLHTQLWGHLGNSLGRSSG